MEQWLLDRQTYAEALRRRVQRVGDRAEIEAYERFLRQTARMQVTANQLTRALSPPFAVAHGLRVQHQGREIYLEHLVVGPTGIFLIETLEGKDPSWEADLARNIAFFRQALGVHAGFFICLVIARTPPASVLPDGAHLVDSLETAIQVVKDQRSGVQFPPSLAQEVWHLIASLRVNGPMRPPGETYLERVSWREWALFLVIVALNTVLSVVDGEGLASWIVGCFLLVFPAMTGMALILLLPRESQRKVGLLVVMVVTLLWFLLLLAAVQSESVD